MADLNDLTLRFPVPQQSGYAVTEDQSGYISAALDGGPPRMRRNIIGGWPKISCTWVLSRRGLSDFEELYYLFSLNPKPFVIELSLDGNIRDYKALFVPNTKQIGNVRGSYYAVTATITAEPIKYNLDDLVAKWELFEKYGKDLLDLVNIFDHLANNRIPRTNSQHYDEFE